MNQIGSLPLGDPQIDPLFIDAMKIFYDELPTVPLFQAKKLLPFNTTYWTNWPTAENDYVVPAPLVADDPGDPDQPAAGRVTGRTARHPPRPRGGQWVGAPDQRQRNPTGVSFNEGGISGPRSRMSDCTEIPRCTKLGVTRFSHGALD